MAEVSAAGASALRAVVGPATSCGIGATIDVDRLSVVALAPDGSRVEDRTVWTDVRAVSPHEAVDRTAALVTEVRGALGTHQSRLCVGVAGLVRLADGTVVTAPNLGWREVPLAAMLAERLGGSAGPICVENEGNLAAVAEAAVRGPACEDLVVLSGGVGLGGGVYSGGRTLHGKEGFAGELGHLKVDPQGNRCGCGRTGCWETKVGLRALLTAAADPDDPVHDPAAALTVRLAEVDRRAELGDVRTLSALHQVGGWLGVGAAALVNVVDPGVIVLSGYFVPLGRWLLEPMRDELTAGAIAPQAGGCRVELSTLGIDAVARGGALTALHSEAGAGRAEAQQTEEPDIAGLIATPSIGGTS